jgi:hypothetical protein
MYGAISIRRPGDPVPDREFVVYLENHLGLDTINGRAFVGNTPTFKARRGDLVQWDVIGLGDGFHVFHVHGHRWLRHGTPVDSELVGPSSSLQVRFREDAPGLWYYHCHVETHQDNGMIGSTVLRDHGHDPGDAGGAAHDRHPGHADGGDHGRGGDAGHARGRPRHEGRVDERRPNHTATADDGRWDSGALSPARLFDQRPPSRARTPTTAASTPSSAGPTVSLVALGAPAP